MSKSKAERSTAETMFVRQGKTLDDIAEALGISKSTLARWSTAGNWSGKRREYMLQSPNVAIDKIKARRAAMVDQMDINPSVDPGLEDRILKINKAIEMLEGKDSLGRTLDVMEEFAAFVREYCDEETAGEICTVTEAFLNRKREEAT